MVATDSHGETKSTATTWIAVLGLFENPLLAGIRDLHGPEVLAVAHIEHFERVFVRAQHAEHLFHRNVFSARPETVRLAFQRNDFVVVFAFYLTPIHRGLKLT